MKVNTNFLYSSKVSGSRFYSINIIGIITFVLLMCATQTFAQQTESDTTETDRLVGTYQDYAFVRAGDFSRSISIPGVPGSFRLGGFAQLNVNYDIDNSGFQQIGTPPTIPLDGDPEDGENQFALHARFTTFNFDYRSATKVGDLRIFIEFDMFGNVGDEFNNDYGVRLRHAGVELGNWRFGQYHSGLTDFFSTPETADPGTPANTVVLRQPSIYYMRGGHEGSNWGIGIENPASDLSGNTDLIRSEAMPHIVAFGRLERDWGYMRLAGLFLQLRSTTEEVYTGGAHLSGQINMPFIREKDNVKFGIQAGEGFVHYFSSFVGGLDGVISADGDIEPTGLLGVHVSYQHWWSKSLRSSFVFSSFELDSPELIDPLSYSGGERYTANLFWNPIESAAFGWEVNYQTIETADGSEGKGLRIEMVSRFFF